MMTVGKPITMVPPWDVGSPMRAAGFPPINTVILPMMILSGGPTHTHESPRVAAGRPPINTVGAPGPTIGPPTCGTGPVNIGQACISVNLAAGPIGIGHLSMVIVLHILRPVSYTHLRAHETR